MKKVVMYQADGLVVGLGCRGG